MATTFPKFDLRLLVHRRRLNMPLTPLLTLLDAESPCLRLEDDDARHLLLALSFERITRIVHDRVECCRPADLSQLVAISARCDRSFSPTDVVTQSPYACDLGEYEIRT